MTDQRRPTRRRAGRARAQGAGGMLALLTSSPTGAGNNHRKPEPSSSTAASLNKNKHNSCEADATSPSPPRKASVAPKISTTPKERIDRDQRRPLRKLPQNENNCDRRSRSPSPRKTVKSNFNNGAARKAHPISKEVIASATAPDGEESTTTPKSNAAALRDEMTTSKTLPKSDGIIASMEKQCHLSPTYNNIPSSQSPSRNNTKHGDAILSPALPMSSVKISNSSAAAANEFFHEAMSPISTTDSSQSSHVGSPINRHKQREDDAISQTGSSDSDDSSILSPVKNLVLERSDDQDDKSFVEGDESENNEPSSRSDDDDYDDGDDSSDSRKSNDNGDSSDGDLVCDESSESAMDQFEVDSEIDDEEEEFGEDEDVRYQEEDSEDDDDYTLEDDSNESDDEVEFDAESDDEIIGRKKGRNPKSTKEPIKPIHNAKEKQPLQNNEPCSSGESFEETSLDEKAASEVSTNSIMAQTPNKHVSPKQLFTDSDNESSRGIECSGNPTTESDDENASVAKSIEDDIGGPDVDFIEESIEASSSTPLDSDGEGGNNFSNTLANGTVPDDEINRLATKTETLSCGDLDSQAECDDEISSHHAETKTSQHVNLQPTNGLYHNDPGVHKPAVNRSDAIISIKDIESMSSPITAVSSTNTFQPHERIDCRTKHGAPMNFIVEEASIDADLQPANEPSLFTHREHEADAFGNKQVVSGSNSHGSDNDLLFVKAIHQQGQTDRHTDARHSEQFFPDNDAEVKAPPNAILRPAIAHNKHEQADSRTFNDLGEHMYYENNEKMPPIEEDIDCSYSSDDNSSIFGGGIDFLSEESVAHEKSYGVGSIDDKSFEKSFEKSLSASLTNRREVKCIVERGKWSLGNVIGEGSFGVVHVGMNGVTGSLMAVKVLEIPTRSKHSMIEDLQREIDLMKSLDHPNIVRYLGAEEDLSKNILYIFQEWVPGGSVSSLLNKFGPFSISVVRSYAIQVLKGLEYLHSHGIIHRDIKGGNILVSNDGVVKLADFGASKKVEAFGTDPDNMMEELTMRGTPYFMAPEVFEEKYGPRADIWSVGGLIYQMATANPPWKDMGFNNPISLFFHLKSNNDVPQLPQLKECSSDGVDRHFYNLLAKVLTRCFQRDPAKRPSASSLLRDELFENTSTISWTSSQQNSHHLPEKADKDESHPNHPSSRRAGGKSSTETAAVDSSLTDSLSYSLTLPMPLPKVKIHQTENSSSDAVDSSECPQWAQKSVNSGKTPITNKKSVQEVKSNQNDNCSNVEIDSSEWPQWAKNGGERGNNPSVTSKSNPFGRR